MNQSRTLGYSIGAGETTRYNAYATHRIKLVINMYPEIEAIGSLEEEASSRNSDSESIEYYNLQISKRISAAFHPEKTYLTRKRVRICSYYLGYKSWASQGLQVSFHYEPWIANEKMSHRRVQSRSGHGSLIADPWWTLDLDLTIAFKL